MTEKDLSLEKLQGKATLTGEIFGFPGDGPGIISQAEIVSYNSKWDPYNPLFNYKAYAQKAGYPDIPAFPCFKTHMGNSPSAIPRDLRDKWYYGMDGSDIQVFHLTASSFGTQPKFSPAENLLIVFLNSTFSKR